MYVKLTDQNMRTRVGEYNETQWVLGEWQEAKGPKNGPLCSPSYVHIYDHPDVASFMNPVHAALRDYRMFEVEIDGPTQDDHGLKRGVWRCRIVREIEPPTLTTLQRVAVAILCARTVCDEPDWLAWSADWLSGKDRSEEAARAEATALAARAEATAWAAWAAVWAAAQEAEEAEAEAEEAEAQEWAAWAAVWAVRAEATAQEAEANSEPIDLPIIIATVRKMQL